MEPTKDDATMETPEVSVSAPAPGGPDPEEGSFDSPQPKNKTTPIPPGPAQAVMLAPTTGKQPDRDRTLVEPSGALASPETAATGRSSDEADERLELMYSKDVAHKKSSDGPGGDKERRKRWLTIGLLAFLAVCTIAAASAVVVLRRRKGPLASSAATAGLAEPDTVSPAPTRTPVPTADPSEGPTTGPTESPSAGPTGEPSAVPTDAPTTSEPSSAPSPMPTRDHVALLQEFLFGSYAVDYNETSNMLAIEWLAEEAARIDSFEPDERLVQRFALLSMGFALRGANSTLDAPVNVVPGVDHCDWDGVGCDGGDEEGSVTEVRWAYQNRTESGDGRISPEVRLLAEDLVHLDLSNNDLVGTIPEELYDATNLEKLYLFRNELEGTISTKIGNLDSITHFHLSHNNLSGSIPAEVKSGASGIRPLEYFNLYRNRLTGTLPESMRFRDMIYFDVGRNELSGTLPDDIGEKFVSLRHAHFDHNYFWGTLPESYNTVGNGRLESFSIDHNYLSGTVPGKRDLTNKLVQYTLHSNKFDAMDKGNCKMEVPQGEMIEFRVDCWICECNGFFDLCDLQCY